MGRGTRTPARPRTCSRATSPARRRARASDRRTAAGAGRPLARGARGARAASARRAAPARAAARRRRPREPPAALRATGSPRPSASPPRRAPAAARRATAAARPARAAAGTPPGAAWSPSPPSLLVVSVGVGWFLISLFQPFKGDGEGQVRVSIPQGASLGEIARPAREQGRRVELVVLPAARPLAGRSGDLKPGTLHAARSDMSYGRARPRSSRGLPPNVVQIAIPEGLSRAEIAPRTKRAARQLHRGQPEQPRARPARVQGQGRQEPRGLPVPGHLRAQARPAVRASWSTEQLTAFKRNFATVDMRYARSKNLTPYDVLTIASLVEREAQVPKERPIDGVGDLQPAQARASAWTSTPRCASWPGTGPGRCKVSELQNPSPYNTRVAHAACRRGRSATPASPRSRRPPTRRRPTTCSTWSAVCGERRAQVRRDRRASSSATWTSTTARATKRGGKSPTEC